MASKIFGDEDTNLHYDLLRCLIDMIPDRELLNLAQTCRSVHNVVEPILQRRKLIATFSEVHIHPSNVLRTILLFIRSPSHAKLVKSIFLNFTIDPIGHLLNEALDELKIHCDEQEQEMIYSTLVQRLTYLTAEQKLEMIKKLKTAEIHESSSFVGILGPLLLCPLLRGFVFSDNIFNWNQYLEPVIAYNHEITASQIEAETTNVAIDLPNITKLNLTNWTQTYGSICLDWLISISSLPTLRRLEIARHGFLQGPWPPPVGHTVPKILSSNLEDVMIESCTMRPEDLAYFLTFLPKLTRLVYSDFHGYQHYKCRHQEPHARPPMPNRITQTWFACEGFATTRDQNGGAMAYVAKFRRAAETTLLQNDLSVHFDIEKEKWGIVIAKPEGLNRHQQLQKPGCRLVPVSCI